MTTPSTPRLDSITLNPIVQQVVARPILGVRVWECDQFRGGYGAKTFGVFHVHGDAEVAGAENLVAWSVVLKICLAEEGDADPDGWTYAPRESLAYQSGLLSDLPAPKCFGVQAQPDGTIWLWLEYLNDDLPGRWTLDRYGLAARHLGQFNGLYLGNRTITEYPWLSRRWMRCLAALGEQAVIAALTPQTWRTPTMPSYFADTERLVRRILTDRASLLDGLDRLPQTLCHNDAWRKNLFACHDDCGVDRTFLIDWAVVATGAVGQEIGPLVHLGVFLFEEEPIMLDSLDQVVFENYVEGLREAGWAGDTRAVRLGYAAASSIYAGGQIAMMAYVALDREWREGWEQALARPFDDILMRAAEIAPFVARLTEEAHTLKAELRV